MLQSYRNSAIKIPKPHIVREGNRMPREKMADKKARAAEVERRRYRHCGEVSRWLYYTPRM